VSSGAYCGHYDVFMWCLVERTAGTMMQRMSDMLTRWLEGAMQRAENEAEADETQDQSDSSEHESASVSVQTDTSAAVEEHVEASVQDVANLRLPLSPVNDATASDVVHDVLCSASREVEENLSLSDQTAQFELVDRADSLTDRTSIKSDNLAVSNDNDLIVDSQLDCQAPCNQDSEADNNLSSTVQSQCECDMTNSTSIVVDGADCDKAAYQSCSFLGTDVSTQMDNQCDEVTAEDKTEAVDMEHSPASPG